MTLVVRAALTDQPITLADHQDLVSHHAAGAVVGFVGMIRDHDNGRQVRQLEYSAHPSAADVLAEVAGRPMRTAAIPFGNYDRSVLRALRGLGYKRLYTSDAGLVVPGAWRVPRTSARPGSGAAWVNDVLARAQQPHTQLRNRAVRVLKGLR